MEEHSDLEHVTGSPTAGESGFVHVEPIDSASMDGSAINQDDGVVVTRVDTVQDESNDLRTTDDGANEEFVDCPDDLISYDERTDFNESQEPEISQDNKHSLEILPQHYQEERQQLMTELTNLRHQLKVLIKKDPLIDGNNETLFTYEHSESTVEGDDKSLWPLHEMIFDCSRFVDLAKSQQSQTDHTIKELYTTLDTKDKEINDLNVKVIELTSFEETTNRVLSSLANAIGVDEFMDTSVNGKMLHLEKGTSFLIQKCNHFLSEVDMLKRKELELTHKSNHFENEYRKVMGQFFKSKETIDMLNSEIGRLKGEVEVEKTKYSNTREKLNLAVSKGKSLVQQRDSLKQEIVKKTSELDECLVELKEKSSALEEMVKVESLANLLKNESFKLKDEIKTMKEDAILKIDCLTVSLLMEGIEKNYLENELADLTQKVHEEVRVLKDKNGCLKIDLQRSEDKVSLLKEKLAMAVKKGKSLVQERESMKKQIVEKSDYIKQQETAINGFEDQIKKMESDLLHSKEERDEIEKFLVESNSMLQKVIDAIGEIVVPNEINDPVEKVKWCASYLNECEVSKAKLEQDLRDVNDEASELTDSLESMKSLEDALSVSERNLSQLNEEKREVEKLKSNIEEKLNNAMKEKIEREQEVGVLKEEASVLTSKLTNSLETMKSLEGSLSISEKNVSRLNEEKRELEILKASIEEELHNAMKENNEREQEVGVLKEEMATLNKKLNEVQTSMKSMEDVVSGLEKRITQLTEEKKEVEASKSYIEEKLQKAVEETTLQNGKIEEIVASKKSVDEMLHKAKEEVSLQNSKYEEVIASKKSVEEKLSVAEKNITVVMSEKENAERELQKVKDEYISQFSHENEKVQNVRNLLESEIKKLKDEVAYHEHKFMDASETIKTLEGQLLKVKNTVSDLIGEKKNAEEEISKLNLQLSECKQELASKQENWSSELLSFIENLKVLLKDETLLNLFKKSIEKKVEIFIEMDHHIKDIKDYFDSEQMQDYPDIEENLQLPTMETELSNDNEADAENIGSYAGKTLEKLNLKNQILSDEFGRLSTFIDELTTSLMIKLEGIKNTIPVKLENTKTLQQNVHDLEIDKRVQEEKMSTMSTEIEELKSELEKTRSMYEKVKEENDIVKSKVYNLETKLEESQKHRDKMGISLQDYQVKEDEWNRKEAELTKQLTSLIKDHESENETRVSEVSEISEVEDPVSIAKRNVLRRGSNDHLALNIDSESDRLINNQETIQDKGHVFKSLHTSGLVPPQAKIIADRLDGLWVSGGGALMSRPRVRLGVIAYWLVLHIWLVGTLL